MAKKSRQFPAVAGPTDSEQSKHGDAVSGGGNSFGGAPGTGVGKIKAPVKSSGKGC